MTTLTDTIDSLKTVDLPDDCLFVNEFSVAQVRQKTTVSIGGKFIYQRGKLHEGRKITLAGTDDSAWIKRSEVKLLKNLFDEPSGKYLLIHNMDTYTVIFDYENPSPLTVEPVIPCSDPDDDAWYTFELNLITVE